MPRVPVVDQDCCISCEVCTQICPEVFRMTGEGHGEEKSEVYNPAGASAEKIEAAMDACPAACIFWE